MRKPRQTRPEGLEGVSGPLGSLHTWRILTQRNLFPRVLLAFKLDSGCFEGVCEKYLLKFATIN